MNSRKSSSKKDINTHQFFSKSIPSINSDNENNDWQISVNRRTRQLENHSKNLHVNIQKTIDDVEKKLDKKADKFKDNFIKSFCTILDLLNNKDCSADSVVLAVTHLGNQLKSNYLSKDVIKNLLIKKTLITKIRELAKHFSTQELSDILWVLAESGMQWYQLEKYQIASSLFDAISEKLNDFKLENCVTTLWALARLNASGHNLDIKTLFNSTLNKVIDYLNNDTENQYAEHIPTLFWSLAAFKFPYDELRKNGLLKQIFTSVEKNASKYTHKELIKTLKAFVLYDRTISDIDQNLIKAIFAGIENTEKEIDERGIISLVWEMAKLGITCDLVSQLKADNVLRIITESLLRLIDQFSLPQYACVIWSLAILSNKNASIDKLAKDLWDKIPFERITSNYNNLCVLHQFSEASEYFAFTLPDQVSQLLQNQPKPESSRFHENVARILIPILKDLGATHIDQEVNEGAFFLDLVANLNNKKVNFEFNGPCHYDDNQGEYPHYRLRNMLLAQKGYTVIPVPKHVWDKEEDKDAYLKSLIDLHAPVQKLDDGTFLTLTNYYLNKIFSIWYPPADTDTDKKSENMNNAKKKRL